MKIVIKVGVSYDDYMSDDALKVDSFSHKCYRLSPPPVFEERAWEQG